jgi:hypothetical protein
MNTKVCGRWALGILFFLVRMPVFAHHGAGSLFQMDKVTTVKATITQFVWANPHCEVSFDGVDGGKARHWTIEANPPNVLLVHGWTRKSLKPGDVVTISFHPGQNGGAWGKLVKVVLPDGKELDQGTSPDTLAK